MKFWKKIERAIKIIIYGYNWRSTTFSEYCKSGFKNWYSITLDEYTDDLNKSVRR